MKKYIAAGEGLPKWASPISHAVVVDNICYLSGQLSIDENGVYVPGPIAQETTQAFDNLFAALRAADFSREDLVFVDVVLADIADTAHVNEVYANLFAPGKRPARTVCQAAALPFGARVKIMGVAIKERSA